MHISPAASRGFSYRHEEGVDRFLLAEYKIDCKRSSDMKYKNRMILIYPAYKGYSNLEVALQSEFNVSDCSSVGSTASEKGLHVLSLKKDMSLKEGNLSLYHCKAHVLKSSGSENTKQMSAFTASGRPTTNK